MCAYLRLFIDSFSFLTAPCWHKANPRMRDGMTLSPGVTPSRSHQLTFENRVSPVAETLASSNTDSLPTSSELFGHP